MIDAGKNKDGGFESNAHRSDPFEPGIRRVLGRSREVFVVVVVVVVSELFWS